MLALRISRRGAFSGVNMPQSSSRIRLSPSLTGWLAWRLLLTGCKTTPVVLQRCKGFERA